MALSHMNTYTPTGSQTFTNQGNDPTTGAPIWSQQQTLAPEQQALYNSNTSNQLNQSGFAGNALDSARNAYQPLSTDYAGEKQKTQDALYKSNTQYLDPQYQQQQTSLDAKLAAQGIEPGSEAYNNAYQQFNAGKDQAYAGARNNAITGATGQEGQQIQQDVALQNQPMNYYNSLMSGTQASTPQFSTPGAASTQPANVTDAINTAYSANVANANAQNAAANQTTASIAGLLAAWLSDQRLKRNIERVGAYPSGLPIYRYQFLWSDEPQIGVMAQEAQERFPEAVTVRPDGYMEVHYEMLH